MIDRHDGLRDARRPGPAGARRSCSSWPTGPCRRGCTAASARSRASAMLVCGTGYTGEDGVELLLDPQHAPAVWDALLAGGARPVGLGARDTLRLEVCFHLYGNDLSEDRGPIEAGLGWCCKEQTGFIGSEAVASARSAGAAREARPVRDRGSRDRAPGQPRDRRRRGDQRDVLAVPRARHRDGVRFRGARRARHADRDRRAWHEPARRASSASRFTERDPEDGRGELSRRPALPPRARLGSGRGRHGDVRDHLVRPGRARRGRVLRPAERRHQGQAGRVATPRSSR